MAGICIFLRLTMNTSLNRIALLLEGEIASGDPDLIISGFNSIQEAEPGEQKRWNFVNTDTDG